MTSKFKARGIVMDFVAAGALTSGTPVLIATNKLGVPLADIAAGATGSVQVAGVFQVNKLSTDVVAQGAALYWDNTNARLTVTATANTLAGFAWAAAGNGAATVEICLNGATA